MLVVLLAGLCWPATGDGLLSTSWGQRWADAQFAPLAPPPNAQGLHERLGCQSTALAQITFFHGLCPTGAVSYTAPGFPTTSMNFSEAARTKGLCDWSNFALAPPNATNDPGTRAVARYEFAASLVVEKDWGTGSYDLRKHALRAEAAERFYDVRIRRWLLGSNATRDGLAATISAEIDARRPLMLMIASLRGQEHWVVVDDYRADALFEVHLNVGHNGYDNSWYSIDAPICLEHYQNGTRPEDGACAFNYDRVGHKELWSIRPAVGGQLQV